MTLIKFKFSIFVFLISSSSCILYVQNNEYRFYDSLDGIWSFVMEPLNSRGIGFVNKWHMKDLSKFKNATVMPVPSAYNDLTANPEIRDHVGWVWYQRKFFASFRDRPYRHFLRFSSVQYYAIVFLNNKIVGDHIGGHLPFELEITDNIIFNMENSLTVAVNNTLSHETIPPGEFTYMWNGPRSPYLEGFFKQRVNFDFFNYAGILRSVYLTKKPSTYVSDITIKAEMNGSFAYKIATAIGKYNVTTAVHVYDDAKTTVFQNIGNIYEGYVEEPKLWWPKGYGAQTMYELEVKLLFNGINIDVYRLPFGFRSVSLTENEIFINGKPFYCRGFGMHEDFELHGRGYDPVVMIRDMNMLEWMAGNCYRTSHYPYSEERAIESDRRGIVVITEVPAVGLSVFTPENRVLHSSMLIEMIERDRNHPSTIMWSIANEPQSYQTEAREYFRSLILLVKSMDITRPVTLAFSAAYDKDKVADMVDVICLNRYFGWYVDMGYLEIINRSWIYEVENWKERFHKPIIISEYGAESIIGLNQEPGRDFSEQYQSDLLKKTHEAFDVLRKSKTIAGEMIWNFADFMTSQDVTRAVGNHKGVLTRTRQPKTSAYVMKQRYEMLANEQDPVSYGSTSEINVTTQITEFFTNEVPFKRRLRNKSASGIPDFFVYGIRNTKMNIATVPSMTSSSYQVTNRYDHKTFDKADLS